MNKVAKYAVLALFVAVSVVYIYTLLSIDWRNTLPTQPDEYFYHFNQLAFSTFLNTQSSLTFNLQGAEVGGAEAHGPFYALFHYFFGLLVGQHHYNLVLLNQLLILFSLWLVFTRKHLSLHQKSMLGIFILAFPVTALYSFTYMQEALHSLIGLGLGFLFYEDFCQTQKQSPSSRYKLSMLILIFIGGLFRPLWFFWSIILLTNTTTWHDKVRYGVISLLYITLAWLHIKFLSEPVPNYFSVIAHLISEGKNSEAIISSTNHFIMNSKSYLKDTYDYDFDPFTYLLTRYLYLLPIIYSLYQAYQSAATRRLHIGALLTMGINFFLLLTFYDTILAREIRVLSPLFYFYTVVLVRCNYPVIQYSYLFLVLIAFVGTYPSTQLKIQQQQQRTLAEFEQYCLLNDFTSSIAFSDAPVKIQLGFVPDDNSFDLIGLPLKTRQRKQIIYGVPYYGGVQKRTPDYVLVRTGTLLPDFERVFENNFFYLYKVGEGQSFKIVNQTIL